MLFCISFGCPASWLDSRVLYKAIPLAPYIVITILVTIFPMLYIISCDYFVTTNLYFLVPLLCNPALLLKSPPLWHPSIRSLHLWVCFFIDKIWRDVLLSTHCSSTLGCLEMHSPPFLLSSPHFAHFPQSLEHWPPLKVSSCTHN